MTNQQKQFIEAYKAVCNHFNLSFAEMTDEEGQCYMALVSFTGKLEEVVVDESNDFNPQVFRMLTDRRQTTLHG